MAEGREGWEGDTHALAQNEHPFPLGHAIWLDPDAEATCQAIMSWWSTWPEEPLPSTDTSSDFSVRHAHVHTRPQAAAFLIGPKGHSIKEVSMTTGAKVATSVNGGKKGKPHVFRVTGATVASIARALEILRAAVLLHTDLMYALAAGRRVTKEHKINNVTFTFLAPGRHAAMRYVHSLSSGHTSSYQVECEPPSSLRVREIERILEDDEFNEDESEKALWEQDAHVQPHTLHSRGSSGAQGEMQDFTPSSHASEASSTPPSSSPSSPRSMSVDSRDGSLNGTTAPPMWTTTANNVQEPTLRPPVLGFGLRSSIWSVGTSGEGMP